MCEFLATNYSPLPSLCKQTSHELSLPDSPPKRATKYVHVGREICLIICSQIVQTADKICFIRSGKSRLLMFVNDLLWRLVYKGYTFFEGVKWGFQASSMWFGRDWLYFGSVFMGCLLDEGLTFHCSIRWMLAKNLLRFCIEYVQVSVYHCPILDSDVFCGSRLCCIFNALSFRLDLIDDAINSLLISLLL